MTFIYRIEDTHGHCPCVITSFGPTGGGTMDDKTARALCSLPSSSWRPSSATSAAAAPPRATAPIRSSY